MGRRIVNNVTTTQTTRPTRQGAAEKTQSDLGQYWDRLKNLIPAEVSAIYIAGQGVIPSGEQTGLLVWAIFCLICAAVFIANESKTGESNPGEKHPVDWIHVAISSISFVVWAYALGGPFVGLGIYVPWIGTLVMIGWTFIVPFIYKGTKA